MSNVKTMDSFMKRVDEMREMPDEVLVDFFSTVSSAAWESRRTANYEAYETDKRMLDFTAEEILNRMKRDTGVSFRSFQ